MYTLSSPSKFAFNATEYQTLFDLTPEDLSKKIVDFPASLNSFSVELLEKNQQVVACDQVYGDPDALQKLSNTILENPQLSGRASILNKFDVDFKRGQKENRYVQGGFPHLPFKDHQFDLMLSSFFFFSPESTLESCWHNLMEMLRVATEVRIYPLLLDQSATALLGSLMLKLQMESFGVEVRSVTFPKLPNSAMLRVWAQNCQLKS
jgi:hypothetical protein